MDSILGKKIDQTQGFLEDGTRVPLSIITVDGNVVTQIKTDEKEGYNSIQVGFGNNKRPTKALAGHIKKAGIEKAPRFFREIRVDEAPSTELGAFLNVAEILEAGDIVDISGTSKGKGFAGVIKRHHFHGGPKTHGQSDRERAPGAIGQGTTPGRVYKGKKMAGNMGNDNVTVKNLLVLDVSDDKVLVKGLIPGVRGGLVVIKKVGTKKKFTPLFTKKVDEEVTEEAMANEIQEKPTKEVTTAEEKVETAEEKIATAVEEVATAEEKVVTAEDTIQVEGSEGSDEVENEVKAEVREEASEEKAADDNSSPNQSSEQAGEPKKEENAK